MATIPLNLTRECPAATGQSNLLLPGHRNRTHTHTQGTKRNIIFNLNTDFQAPVKAENKNRMFEMFFLCTAVFVEEAPRTTVPLFSTC